MTTEEQKAEAHAVLDQIRAGEGRLITQSAIDKALRVLGDTVGLRHYTDDGEPIFYLERRS